MFVMNITDDHNDRFSYCTDTEIDNNNNIVEYLILSIPANIILLSLIGLVLYTMVEHFITNKCYWIASYTQIIQFSVLLPDRQNAGKPNF